MTGPMDSKLEQAAEPGDTTGWSVHHECDARGQSFRPQIQAESTTSEPQRQGMEAPAPYHVIACMKVDRRSFLEQCIAGRGEWYQIILDNGQVAWTQSHLVAFEGSATMPANHASGELLPSFDLLCRTLDAPYHTLSKAKMAEMGKKYSQCLAALAKDHASPQPKYDDLYNEYRKCVALMATKGHVEDDNIIT